MPSERDRDCYLPTAADFRTIPTDREYIAELRRRLHDLEDVIEALLISAPGHTLYVSDLAKMAVRNGGRIGIKRYEYDRRTAYYWDDGKGK